MLGSFHNSIKKYAKEARDTHKLVSTLRNERPIFPFTFERIKALPLHDDPLVIMIKIAHCEVRKVLVDKGSSLDLLYLFMLLDMGIDPKEITQQQMPLVGFNDNVTMSIGTI